MHEWCVCVRASSSVCACVNHTCVSARRCRIWRVAGPKINRHTLCGLRGRAGRRGPIKRAADLSDVIWWWCAAWCAENESSRTALITRFIAFASNLCRARTHTPPDILFMHIHARRWHTHTLGGRAIFCSSRVVRMHLLANKCCFVWRAAKAKTAH